MNKTLILNSYSLVLKKYRPLDFFFHPKKFNLMFQNQSNRNVYCRSEVIVHWITQTRVTASYGFSFVVPDFSDFNFDVCYLLYLAWRDFWIIWCKWSLLEYNVFNTTPWTLILKVMVTLTALQVHAMWGVMSCCTLWNSSLLYCNQPYQLSEWTYLILSLLSSRSLEKIMLWNLVIGVCWLCYHWSTCIQKGCLGRQTPGSYPLFQFTFGPCCYSYESYNLLE